MMVSGHNMSLSTHFPMKVAHGKTVEVPVVGYGTWAAGETGWCKDATLKALKAGYRHLDCAWMYGVDSEVGAAIHESGIPRSDLFITSKFWPHFASPENVEICLDLVLQNMGLEYLDLFLAHWPVAFKAVPREQLLRAVTGPGTSNGNKGMLVEQGTDDIIVDWEHTSTNLASKAGHEGSFVATWQAMQKLVKSGKVRAIGVSNFSISDIKPLLNLSAEIPVSCCQVEVHPWLPNNELISFCRQHDILVSCYCPFAGQKADGETLIQNEVVKDVAKRNKMDVGQCLQSWAVQRGTIPLGKSATDSRIKANLDVKRLPDADMKVLDNLEVSDGQGRTVGLTKPWGVSLYSD